MNENIKILYIDDNFQLQLTSYLENIFSDNFSQFNFTPETTIVELLNNPDVLNATVIILDSRLFQNSNVDSDKFSGEEVKIIFKKFLPFIEILIISQNEDVLDDQFIKKFKTSKQNKDYKRYYDDKLLPKIELAIKKVNMYKKIAAKMEESGRFDEALITKLKNSMDGLIIYDELNKSDIDNLIKAFKDLESKYDD